MRTVEDVREAVENIEAIAADDEQAHGAEDLLHQAVLRAIADSRAVDPRAMAREALRTRDVEFSRWCA